MENWKIRHTAALFAVLLLSLAFCSRPKFDVVPDKKSEVHSLKIKAKVKNICSGEKQNFKILVKFDDRRTRMLFLGAPLNRIYAKLLVDGEAALLINAKKRRYWQGDFKTLLQQMWDIDFDYQEFKRLIRDGIIPEKKTSKSGLHITITREESGPGPAAVEITGRDLVVRLKISDRETRPGRLRFSENLDAMTGGDIEDVLEK